MIIGTILVDQFMKDKKNDNGFILSNMEDEMHSNDGR